MNSATIEKKLKKELILELQRKSPDISKIQKLTIQLSNLDRNTVGFSVDAAIIDRLGRELVAKQETALSELVKNSYDADATQVDLLFIDSEQPGGILLVKDNGHGMNREELINGFMRISSTDKVHNPISPKYKRQRAGRKGIGRFAAQRLGHRLIITTKKDEAKKALKVVINWDEFEQDKDLFSIRSRIEETDFDGTSGTILKIENLRDAWTETAIRRVYRYILDLIQPFPLSKERESFRNRQDPGFKASFYQVVKGELKSVIDEESYIFDYALAEIEAFVDNEGQGYWSLTSNKLGINEKNIKIGSKKDIPDSKYQHLRNINLKAYYFIYEPNLIPPQQLTRIRRLADEKGGIKLYRNGFRVLPYGEPFDDWLKLDYSVRRRQILAPHGNNNFFGFVEITDIESEKFEETASREGLIENTAFKELVDLCHRVLIAAVIQVSRKRKRKATSSDKDFRPKKNPAATVQKVATQLEEIIQKYDEEIEKTDSKELREIKKRTQTTLHHISQDLIEIQAELEEMPMLRVFAGLGLVIGMFIHEIRMFFTSLEASTLNLLEKAKEDDAFKNEIKTFRDNFSSLRGYTSYFDTTISLTVNRERKPIELRDVINRFRDVSYSTMKREGITFVEPEIKGYNLFTRPMHPSEWSSIIFNLFSNSKKAIKRRGNKGRIFIRAGKTKDKVFLEFADNGDGIPEENRDKIFDAFFTTTSPSGPLGSDFDDILGSGLGLKIVKDIVTGYNGDIFLVEPPKGYSTCFRIEIPQANKKDIDENAY